MVTKAGSKLDILLNATSRRDEHENIVGMVGIGQDITQLRAEHRLRDQMIDNFNLFIKNANALIFAVDSEKCICEWNEKCEEVTDYSRAEVIGRPVEDIVPDLFRSQIRIVMDNALNRIETSRFRVPVFTKRGELATLLLSATTQFSDMFSSGGESTSDDKLMDQVVGAIFVGSDALEESLTVVPRKPVSNTREVLAPIRELIPASYISLFDKRVNSTVPLIPLYHRPSIIPKGLGVSALGTAGMVLPAALPGWGRSATSQDCSDSESGSTGNHCTPVSRRRGREGWGGGNGASVSRRSVSRERDSKSGGNVASADKLLQGRSVSKESGEKLAEAGRGREVGMPCNK